MQLDLRLLQIGSMITPTGTETNLTTTGGEYVFRTCYIDSRKVKLYAKYASENLEQKKWLSL